VYKEYRGQGHGERLMRSLLDAAYVRGYAMVWLYVAPDNHVAISLYLKLGFQPKEQTERGLRMTKVMVP